MENTSKINYFPAQEHFSEMLICTIIRSTPVAVLCMRWTHNFTEYTWRWGGPVTTTILSKLHVFFGCWALAAWMRRLWGELEKTQDLGVQQTWIAMLALLLYICVTMVRPASLSVPDFSTVKEQWKHQPHRNIVCIDGKTILKALNRLWQELYNICI